MSVFTKTHAENTAKKLKTKPKNAHYPRLSIIEVRGQTHVMQQIWCDGEFILDFGIKHASNRNNTHGWVARELNLSPNKMYSFAICTMSIDEMIAHFIEDGTITASEGGDTPSDDAV